MKELFTFGYICGCYGSTNGTHESFLAGQVNSALMILVGPSAPFQIDFPMVSAATEIATYLLYNKTVMSSWQ